MLSILNLLGINLFIIIVFMVVGWLFSLKIRNVTVVDSMWGMGFVLIAWLTFVLSDGFVGRGVLILTLVTLWGGRLSIHLGLRSWGREEDPRYGKWRTSSGDRFWIVSLFKVFLLQAIVLWVIALNMQVGLASSTPDRLTVWDLVGTLIWVTGFTFEAVADWQLAKFKSVPANRTQVMTKGLWAFSRHPNYFGEVLVWWGIFVITLSQPANIWSIISPILITLVVLKMTGIPLTESHLAGHRIYYNCYRQRTSAFVPWFPKKGVTCEHAQ